MSTEIAFGGNFDVTNISVGAPVKSTDSNKYHVFPIKYKSQGFGVMETGTVTATRLKDDPKLKPGILSQGFHLENKPTLAILEQAEQAIWEGLLKLKGSDPELPNYLKDSESVADLRAAGKFIKMKGLVHYPKAKDAKGNMTKNIDPNITPLVYGKLIQCGARHPETPFRIHSKYYDKAVLNADVKLAITEGRDKMENYLIPAGDLWKKKISFKAKWTIVIGDVFVSDTVLKIRRSITDVWVMEICATESAAQKAMSAAVASSGEKIEATRLNIPASVQGDDSDDEGAEHSDGPDDVVRNTIPGPKAEDGKFDVKINGN